MKKQTQLTQRIPAAARTPAQLAADLQRHARKCAICNHPDCDSIESDFLNWRSEATITLNYQLPSRSSVYRHAAAAGLLERRRANLRGVCERIIERVDQAPPSGMAVLRALRIYSQITEDGHWAEPPKHSLVTHVHVTEHATTVGAGLSRPQNGLAPEPSSCHPACPEGRREPIRASRGWCEGSAVHDQPQSGSALSANRSVPDIDYVPHWARGLYSDTNKASASAQKASPIAPNANGANDLNASRTSEILIGTQNASREKTSHGKRSG